MSAAARDADVAVVGAGLAGLAAAREVADAGRSAVVVEARERVGGRTERYELSDGVWVDVGGQWLGPTQDRMYALCRELDVELFPTHTEGDSVIEFGGRLRRYSGTIPRISAPVLVESLRTQRRLERMAGEVPPAAPWTAPRAREWDGQTFGSWLRRHCRTRGARALFEIATKAVWAAMPGDVSLLHVLFYIRSAGNLDLLLDTAGGAQQDRFVTGAQTVSIRLAERLGDAVVLGSPVRRIEHGSDRVRVVGDGVEVSARHAVVAIPPTLAGRIAYDPPLPGYRDQLTQRFPMGSVVKCMAVYERPFWRDAGLSGEGLTERGPMNVMFDNSPSSGRPGIVVGFLEGREARELGRRSEAERRQGVVDSITRVLGPQGADPVDYIERSWAEEEWSRGCYEGFTPPGVLTEFGPALREPIGPIHWAGTETAIEWNGYMEGAVESGRRAAREALDRI